MKCPAEEGKTCDYGDRACKYFSDENCLLKENHVYEVKIILERIENMISGFLKQRGGEGR